MKRTFKENVSPQIPKPQKNLDSEESTPRLNTSNCGLSLLPTSSLNSSSRTFKYKRNISAMNNSDLIEKFQKVKENLSNPVKNETPEIPLPTKRIKKRSGKCTRRRFREIMNRLHTGSK